MSNEATIIVDASVVLDFDQMGIFPSVKDITDELLKRCIQKVEYIIEC